MPGEESTTKLNVDISELKKAMQEAKRSAALANSEFQATASTMDDWSKSSDGISAKLKQLNSNMESQKTVLNSLEAQYAAVVEEQGKSSKAAQDLEIKINKQKATINNTEREISKYENSLEEVSKAEKIAAATGKDVSEVLDDLGNEAEEASDGFTVLKGAIATFAGNAMSALAGSIKNGISNIIGLADETREYRTEMGKLDTAFTTNGHNAESARQTYEELQAVLGDEGQAVEAANFLAKLCKSEEDLANWTNIATGVYGTFGASLPIEGLTEAANETAKVGQVTGAVADALNWTTMSTEQWNSALGNNPKAMAAFNKGIKEGMSQEDAFNEALAKCSTEQQRQELIMNSLNTMYGKAADAYRENNGAIMEANRAQSALTDAQARLGEVAEPVITTVKQGFADLLSAALDLVSGVDMDAFTQKIKDGFAILKDDVLPAVKDGFQWIIDNKDTLIAGLAGIAGGFAAFKAASLINQAVTAFKAFKAAQEGATVAQWLMNAAMNANPIMLIVTVIAAVVAAIVTFIATNDEARAKFTKIWQGVKDFFVGVWDGICNFFTKTIPKAFKTVIDWVKTNFDSLLLFLINPFAGLFDYFYDNNKKFKEWVDNAVAQIKELPGKIWTWLQNTINKVTTWTSNMTTKAKEAGTKFVGNVVNFIKELPGKIWTWLQNTISKVTTWASNMATKAKNAATQFINNVINTVKGLPNKIWTWLKNTISKVTTWASDMATKAKNAATNFINNVINIIKGLPGKIGTWLSNATQKVASWGSDLAAKGRQAATDLYNAVVNKVKEIANKMLSIGKDIVAGIWEGISGSYEWIKNKISGWVGNVTNFIKKIFKIGSPSKLMRDEVGVWLPRGIAVGIDKGAKFVTNSLTKLTNSVLNSEKKSVAKINEEVKKGAEFTKELLIKLGNFRLQSESEYANESERIEKEKAEAEYQSRLANAKDAAELEQIKQERIQQEAEEAQQDYLDSLKKTADKERSIFDNAVSYIESFVDDAVEKFDALHQLQQDIADSLKGEGSLTTSTITFIAGEGEEVYTKLADVGADNEILRQYNDMLDELTERRGVLPLELAGYLSEMGLSDGMDYVHALLNASDEEFEKYLNSLMEKSNLSEEISRKITTAQTINLKDEIMSGLDELPSDLAELGNEGAANFGESLIYGLGLALNHVRDLLTSSMDSLLDISVSELTRDTISNMKNELSKAKSNISGTAINLSNGGKGTQTVVKNYTQNIYSPTAPSRLDLYRNTKNLLGLATI